MKYLLIVGLIVFCAGCGVTGKQPALHDFGALAPAVATQGKASVSVNAPTWLWDNRIRYRLLFALPSQVKFYGLDRWIASPPEMLEQFLVLDGKAHDYALIIRLLDFEQQFTAPDRAVVVLSFTVDAYSDNKKIGSQEFFLQQPAKTPDAAGAITGFTNLARLANEKIQGWLTGLPQRAD